MPCPTSCSTFSCSTSKDMHCPCKWGFRDQLCIVNDVSSSLHLIAAASHKTDIEYIALFGVGIGANASKRQGVDHHRLLHCLLQITASCTAKRQDFRRVLCSFMVKCSDTGLSCTHNRCCPPFTSHILRANAHLFSVRWHCLWRLDARFQISILIKLEMSRSCGC